ncbi:hypothetical protein [Streptosporangium sp. NPDC048865]|uniref:hypothetical protein n=1 Tax=Streptosporangium sp. NPDC048865 TaxID=3155766 RepID=UPI0034485DDE
MNPDPQVVYVITDLDPKPQPKTSVWASIHEVLRPTFLVGLVAAPLLALVLIPVGLLLGGWPPFLLFATAVIASPALVNLVDLLGARVGWPPLSWVASQMLAQHSTTASKETRPNG